MQSVSMLINSYFNKTAPIEFDYKLIRPSGALIKGFGGISSGPEPLIQLHNEIRSILDKLTGQYISITGIVDIMNLIGRCVVSGNVRRTAEIAFGDPDSEEYIDLKNYEKNEHRKEWGWTSNNSVFAKLGMNYNDICNRIKMNGEPGIAWLQNMQQFSRMNNIPDFKDNKAKGGNPCLEQTLESFEMCCLVETFPAKHNSFDDFAKTLKYAYLYAKTVTLGTTHWPETNRVLLRNRRIGCSMSGIAQFLSKYGHKELQEWCNEGYKTIQYHDKQYSDWFCIPQSIKTTCIKPSGTVSLLAGATPGMHYPLSTYYIRRVRMPITSELLPALEQSGYTITPAFESPNNTVVVEFPIYVGPIRKANQVSMWEQLELASFLQQYWADNQVSCTVTFDPLSEGPQLSHALNYFQYRLKGVSFLPLVNQGYQQMPYEEITEEKYKELSSKLKPINWKNNTSVPQDPIADKFCQGDTCNINM